MSSLISLLLMVVAAAAGYVYWATRDLPPIDRVLQQGVNPSRFTQVYAADGTVILSYGKFRQKPVHLQEVSPHLVDALLATEDRRFYQHHGVDPIALGRAILRDIRYGKMLEGGSTLTQQLARTVFLSNERSLKRKVREAVLALKLEDRLSKQDILELYLNNIYFGEGAYGIAAASEIYFNKKPSDLTLPEAALLAGLPQAPSQYSPFNNLQAAETRRGQVLSAMVAFGKLAPEERDRLTAQPVRLNAGGRDLASGDRAPFFNRFVLKQVKSQFDLDEQSFWQSGLKIYTTLDPNAQYIAARTVRTQSEIFGRVRARQQAALVSLNPHSGAILAYVGGKDYRVSQFDRVSQALRSPGSLFKVFTYATALEKGYDPTRVYLDEPLRFGDWRPQNFDKTHHGYMTMARAMAYSNNVVAVKVLNELGPPTVIDVAHRMGLEANLDNNLSLTLGGSGVTLLDITAAFGVVDNRGVRVEPYAIEKIIDPDGQVLYNHTESTVNVLDRTTVDTLIGMMQGVVQYGTGRPADIGRPVAGKTGTSDDHRDAWFIGFTPEVITGVWVGNDDNSPMKGMVGGTLPAAIWRTYMRAILADRLATNFDLAYSKPLTPNDFFQYKLANLSQGERLDPNVARGRAGEEGDPSELPDDGETPANPPADGGDGSVQPGDPATLNERPVVTPISEAQPMGPPPPSPPSTTVQEPTVIPLRPVRRIPTPVEGPPLPAGPPQ